MARSNHRQEHSLDCLLRLSTSFSHHEAPGAGFTRNPLVKLRIGFTLIDLKLHRLSLNEWW